ncbi:beta-ketoacyl synthase N-terminal-like domain-containing protein [Streptomyces polygonati]|uniref:Beta-ketoacyl synthase N-terminal-like domain-containing protein n=1 Tax=Streptomyces polygonati TaxID=1617087 RepID=A0ABV8HJT5_9ACTN
MSPGPAVVTGMAWSTPLGDDLHEVWERLCSGSSGVAPVPSPYRLRTELAAVVPAPAYRPGGAEAWERQVALAARTMAAALKDAGLSADDPRLTLVLGTSFGAQLDSVLDPPEDWAAAAARQLGHLGRPMVVSTACSAGSDSLLVAEALIRGADDERIFLTGGVDVLTEAKRLGHSALGTMSRSGLRAFDVDRDGMILGEGAGFLVLEAAPGARRRGARAYATLRGTGSANDAFGLTAPDPSGSSVTASVRRSLAGSGTEPGEVSVISAHGTGTPLNDEVEAAGLQRLFGGGSDPVVFATKGALGHSLGATGAIEAVATVLALREGRVPPITGLGSPLPGLTLRLPAGQGGPVHGTAGISLTLGFGGFNTCLLFTEAPADVPADVPAAPGRPLRAPGVAGGRPPAPLSVVGHARLTVADPESRTRNRTSFYADPLAWLIVSAVEEAIAPCREDVLAEPGEVAVLVTADDTALPTHRRIAQGTTGGRVSPLRFAGSNPGILAGLTCSTLGLRGPSLVLSLDPDDAADTARTVAADWLRAGKASYVLWAAHRRDDDSHTAGCVVFRAAVPADDPAGGPAGDPAHGRAADGAAPAREPLTEPLAATVARRV